MIVSAGLPTCMEGMMYPVPFAAPEDIVRIAQHAEKFGYHSVWGNDHMTTQKYVRDEFSTPPNFWEPLTTYAYLVTCPPKTDPVVMLGSGIQGGREDATQTVFPRRNHSQTARG